MGPTGQGLVVRAVEIDPLQPDMVADPHAEKRIYATTTNGGTFSFEPP